MKQEILHHHAIKEEAQPLEDKKIENHEENPTTRTYKSRDVLDEEAKQIMMYLKDANQPVFPLMN